MHIRYRPTSFTEIIGNNILIKSLKDVLKNKPVRPILFVGPKGCAKTTLSYIVAKEFGGNNLELIERDCEDLSKVEDTRELIDRIFALTLFDTNKCIILDELHGLSLKSQEVLLKPLEFENIKNNILFIACTTEIKNIKETLLSRFIQYRVSPLSEKESLELLNRVCTGENISIPKWLQVLLIEKSEGIPRRLLTGLSKVKSVTDESEAKFLLDLNSIDESSEVLELFKMLLKGVDWKDIKKYLQIILKDNSPESIRISLMNLIGGRLSSDYLKYEEIPKLIEVYNILRNVNNIPEKASLQVDICKIVNIFKR
jgi:DNA polymerase-3 subunit gamma/tau